MYSLSLFVIVYNLGEVQWQTMCLIENNNQIHLSRTALEQGLLSYF